MNSVDFLPAKNIIIYSCLCFLLLVSGRSKTKTVVIVHLKMVDTKWSVRVRVMRRKIVILQRKEKKNDGKYYRLINTFSWLQGILLCICMRTMFFIIFHIWISFQLFKPTHWVTFSPYFIFESYAFMNIVLQIVVWLSEHCRHRINNCSSPI